MTKLFLSFLMIILSLIMILMSHPLSIGLMILLQTLLMCLLSGMLIKTYWFSYILFLTFLGGLLVLFIYVSSIASNEMFKLNFNMKMYFLMIFNFFIVTQIYLYFFNENLNWLNLSNNINDNDNFMHLTFFNNENKISLNKLYNNHFYMLMLMLVIYLFISLIAIVKITNIFYGPLRSML